MSEQELEVTKDEDVPMADRRLSKEEALSAIEEMADFVTAWCQKYPSAFYGSYGVTMEGSSMVRQTIASNGPVKLGYAVVISAAAKEKEYLREILTGTYQEGQGPDVYREGQMGLLNLLVGVESEIKRG